MKKANKLNHLEKVSIGADRLSQNALLDKLLFQITELAKVADVDCVCREVASSDGMILTDVDGVATLNKIIKALINAKREKIDG
jgi:hypothetical protein